ncbi:ABC transporter ATP-binding protein [Catellatospora methionotrophica]|uniref:ABC transporter ATP-binding protein n=1 Tax=Catellatospora methionotrophica TaxID=121620 RepID=UPI0033DD983D
MPIRRRPERVETHDGPAIELRGIGRTYRTGRETVVALRGVDLVVKQGQVVGMLGRNGAGKTTLTKILSTLLLPTSGTARVFGHDLVSEVRAVRQLTGVVFGGDRGLYERLTARENIQFFAMLNGVARRTVAHRIREVLADSGLETVADRPVESFSKGMRQRLHIAIGMVTRPRLLLLDEPTVGLDPVEAERLRTAIGQLRDDGTTILLTSHYLLDIERLADRVVLLAQGRLVADVETSRFTELAGHVATVTVRGRGLAPEALRRPIPGLVVDVVKQEDPLWMARLRVEGWAVGSFTSLSGLLGAGDVVDFSIAPVRLEDAYTELENLARRWATHTSATGAAEYGTGWNTAADAGGPVERR